MQDELTNGSVDPAHYGPIGDAARSIASYCDGPARVHVYTKAFDTLTAWNTRAAFALAAAQAEVARLREALELADAALRGANMNMNVVERKVSAALKGE